MDMTCAVEARDLTRRFGRTDAVAGLNLRVSAGSVFALIGPNGAGKTTTLKLLMNLLRPTGGKATVLGVDVRRLGPAQWQQIGYVSENQRLPDWMTPGELFDFCRPFYPAWDDALQRKLQADLGLTTRAPLRTLSRGTRMKAALLASLAYRPDLILLDEPFTGLDPMVRDELTRGLLEVAGAQTMTALISSHDIDEVERLADQVGFMYEGRLQFAEPVAALLDRFRLVEVVTRADRLPAIPAGSDWVPQGSAGRTLTFIDTSYDARSPARIAAAFPDCAIHTSPLALREIFVVLARHASSTSPMEQR
jgi:ABC-2 type transport system ATP-binding protein